MPKITLTNVTKQWGNFIGVNDLNLEIEDGAFVTLLGLAVFFPVCYGILGAFRAPSEFASGNARLLPESFLHTENFAAVFRRAPIGRYYLNSFATSFASALVSLRYVIEYWMSESRVHTTMSASIQ